MKQCSNYKLVIEEQVEYKKPLPLLRKETLSIKERV